jgi:hypothetical protein
MLPEKALIAVHRGRDFTGNKIIVMNMSGTQPPALGAPWSRLKKYSIIFSRHTRYSPATSISQNMAQVLNGVPMKRFLPTMALLSIAALAASTVHIVDTAFSAGNFKALVSPSKRPAWTTP